MLLGHKTTTKQNKTLGTVGAQVTGAVAWPMKRQCFHMLVYIDFVRCQTSLAQAREAIDCLLTICDRLGSRFASDT